MAAKKQAKPKKVMKQKAKSKKAIKKSFYEVDAPITSTKIQLYAPSQESLENKTVKIDLTKILRGKSLELKLRIKKVGEKLIGVPESVQLMVSYIRRVMRKGTDYCEDSFEAETRDFKVRIKPLLVTRRRVSRAVLKAIRETAKKHLTSHLKTRDAEEIFSDIISNKLQKQLSLKIKKVYPLALCEIRIFETLKPLDKKSKKEDAEVKTEDVKVEEKKE